MIQSFLKRFLAMLGATLLVILLGFVTLFLKSQPVSIPPAPLPPTYTAEPTPVLDTEVEQAVVNTLFPYLKESAYHSAGGSEWLLMSAVSSGVYTATQRTLPSGETVYLDILNAYVLMRPGKVLEVPVLIGLQALNQPYATFSDLFFYQNLYQIPSPTFPTRHEALADIQSRLPRGRVFLLLAEGGVSAAGLDWEACKAALRDFRGYPPQVCQLGEALDQAYPGELAAFIQKSAYSFPRGWILAGWFFQELDPLETPDSPADVSLPPLP